MKSKAFAYPYLIWMAIFIIVPLFIVLYFAFTDQTGSFTLQNLISAGNFMSVFSRSIFLALVATVICLVIAYPMAYMLSKSGANVQRTMLVLVMLPMWMNFLLRTYAWMSLLEETGLINRFFGLFGIGPFEMINTGGAVILGMVYNYLPFMILPLYSVMTKLDSSLVEAAQDLGADGYKTFTKVIIPLTMPGITTGITMVFVPSISTFIISRLLGGGSSMLIGDLIELHFLGNTYNPHVGSALSLVLMVIILLCMSLMNQFDQDEEGGGVVIS